MTKSKRQDAILRIMRCEQKLVKLGMWYSTTPLRELLSLPDNSLIWHLTDVLRQLNNSRGYR